MSGRNQDGTIICRCATWLRETRGVANVGGVTCQSPDRVCRADEEVRGLNHDGTPICVQIPAAYSCVTQLGCDKGCACSGWIKQLNMATCHSHAASDKKGATAAYIECTTSSAVCCNLR